MLDFSSIQSALPQTTANKRPAQESKHQFGHLSLEIHLLILDVVEQFITDHLEEMKVCDNVLLAAVPFLYSFF